MGFEVIGEAANGMDALRFLRDNTVDVVLTDIRMPVMSGIDLAREISESLIKTKIVFLSGYEDFGYAKCTIQYKVRSYISKPTRLQDIRRTFAQLRSELTSEQAAVLKRATAADTESRPSGRFLKYLDYDSPQLLVEHAKNLALEDLRRASLRRIARGLSRRTREGHP